MKRQSAFYSVEELMPRRDMQIRMEPKFSIVQFTKYENGMAWGSGQYTSATLDTVQDDIDQAKAYARTIKLETGCHTEVSYSLDNNIVEIAVKAINANDVCCDMIEKLVLPDGA